MIYATQDYSAMCGTNRFVLALCGPSAARVMWAGDVKMKGQ